MTLVAPTPSAPLSIPPSLLAAARRAASESAHREPVPARSLVGEAAAPERRIETGVTSVAIARPLLHAAKGRMAEADSENGAADEPPKTDRAEAAPEAVGETGRGEDPDRALVARALAGDERAFNELFTRHRGDVARLVFRFVRTPAEVEDVTQDVLLHVFRSLASFRGDSRFSTWLYRLTVNVTRMHLRKKRSRPQIADVDVPEGGTSMETRDVPLEPDALVDQRARVRTLYRLLDTLSDKKREVLVLHDLEGVAMKDIAESLGIPVMTVRTRLFYARKELYAAMAQESALTQVLDALGADLHGKPALSQPPPAATAPEVPAGSESAAAQRSATRRGPPPSETEGDPDVLP